MWRKANLSVVGVIDRQAARVGTRRRRRGARGYKRTGTAFNVNYKLHVKKHGVGSVHKYHEARQQERQVVRDLSRQRRQGAISNDAYTKAVRESNSRMVNAYHPGYLGLILPSVWPYQRKTCFVTVIVLS